MPQLRRKSLTKINLELFLNNVLLTDGFYTNISVGDTDFYANDLSALIEVQDDPSFPLPGSIWQSAFKEWVHEEGITPLETGIVPPVVASGVTVDAVFYPKDPAASGFNPAFAHNIDYRNGRVIFTTPIATTSAVQASFAYKHITVDFSDEFEGENRPLLIETSLKDNPAVTGVEAYPALNAQTLPIVLIDFQGRTHDPYELGNQTQVAVFNGFFHVWARDHLTRDRIEDAISERARDVVLGIDFNTTAFPLDEMGDKNPLFTRYIDLAQIWSAAFWRRIY